MDTGISMVFVSSTNVRFLHGRFALGYSGYSTLSCTFKNGLHSKPSAMGTI